VADEEKANFKISVNVECLIIPEYVLKRIKKPTLTPISNIACAGKEISSLKKTGVPSIIK
jgi:hypothetical protein